MASVEFQDKGLDPRTTRMIAREVHVAGAPAEEWWARQAATTRNAFMDVVRTSLRNGESYAQAAARITGGTVAGVHYPGFMTASRAQASALAATSLSAITNAVRLESFNEMSDVIKAIQQISTLDNRTSDVCIAYSGETWQVKTLKPLGPRKLPFNGGPPRHFNCRSTLVPITKSFKELGLKGTDMDAGTRASMDGQVAGDITFDAWLKTKGDGFVNRLLGVKRAELWRAGKITTKDLVDMRGRPLSVEQLEALVAQRAAPVAPKPKESTPAPVGTTSLQKAVDRYIDRFGEPPPMHKLRGSDADRVKRIEQALKSGIRIK